MLLLCQLSGAMRMLAIGVTIHPLLIVATGVYLEYLICGMKLSSPNYLQIMNFLPSKWDERVSTMFFLSLCLGASGMCYSHVCVLTCHVIQGIPLFFSEMNRNQKFSFRLKLDAFPQFSIHDMAYCLNIVHFLIKIRKVDFLNIDATSIP